MDKTSVTTEHRQLHIAYADAMRATAIFVVVLHHVVFLTRPAIGDHRAFEFGYLGAWGVNCFFVLSGYLLGGPYLAAILDPTRVLPSVRKFYTRRILRIYPLYAVAIVLSSVATYFTYRTLPSAMDIGTHLLMIHTLSERYATSLNGPLWTMAVDAQFYILLPLVAAATAWALRASSASMRRRTVYLGLLCVFSASLAFHYIMLVTEPATIVDFAAAVVIIRNVIGFAGTFALGMLIRTVGMTIQGRLPTDKRIYGGLIIVGLIIAALQISLRMGDAPPGPIDQMRILRLTFNEALAAISVSLIFFGLISAQFKMLSAVARSKAVVTGAALSYAVYLVHWPIIDGVSMLLHRPHGIAALLKVGSLSIAIVVPVAYVLHRAIEKPLLRLKDTLRDPQRSSTLPTRASPSESRPVQEASI